MSAKKILVACCVLLAGLAQAAGEAPAKTTGRRTPAAVIPVENESERIARAVFQVLLGEFALRSGDVPLAGDAWGDLALRSRDPKALVRAIEVLSAARKFERAIDLADVWLQIEPDSARAQQVRTSLLVLANRLDEFAPQVEAVVREEPAALAANFLQLNQMFARSTDKKAVLRLVERVAVPYANLPEAQLAIAQAAFNADALLRALPASDEALRLRPDWEIAALLRAQILARQNSDAAIAWLDTFVLRQPLAHDARLMLARLLVGEKRYEAARPHFDRLFEVAPDRPEVIYPLAILALQQGDLARGKAQLERLLATDFPGRDTVHFFLGQIDEEGQDWPAALAHYRLVGAGEQYVPSRLRSALILQKLGRFDEARAVLHADERLPLNEKVPLLLAESQLLREMKHPDEAYQLLDKALQQHPAQPELLYEIALLADRLGKFDTMEKCIRQLLRLQAEHPHALNALGYSLAERNIRLPEASRLIAQALALAPEDPFIMDSMGWVQFRQGRLSEALATLEKAFALKEDPEIAAHLGEVLWKLGRKADAIRLLDRMLRQNPEHEVLQATRRKLRP